MVHEMKNETVWKKLGYTEKKVREKKETICKAFPETYVFFNELLAYLKKNKILD